MRFPFASCFAASLVFAACLRASSVAAQPAPGQPSQAPSTTPPPPPPVAYPPPGYAPYAPPYPGYQPVPYPVQSAPMYAAPPAELPYYESQPIPNGYHLESRARRGLVIAGAITLGVPYVFSASVASSSKDDRDTWLVLPVVGPFIDFGSRKGCDTAYCGSGDSDARFLLMLDGLTQAAGATMLIVGLAYPQKLLVRDNVWLGPGDAPKPSWSIAPRVFGRTGAGLAFASQF